MELHKKDRKIANFFDCLKATQSLHRIYRIVLQKKDRKIANFLTAQKRHNRFIALKE